MVGFSSLKILTENLTKNPNVRFLEAGPYYLLIFKGRR